VLLTALYRFCLIEFFSGKFVTIDFENEQKYTRGVQYCSVIFANTAVEWLFIFDASKVLEKKSLTFDD
jgi:hypothetical protein